MYSLEAQLIEALPLIIEKTTNPELKRAFTLHLEESRRHAEILYQICEALEVNPEGKFCVGIEGILEEGTEMLTANPHSPVLDLALIGIVQKIEHYEIASYGTVANYAQEMGHTDTHALLVQTLTDEKLTDEKLTDMAEAIISEVAARGQIAPVAG